MPNFDYHYREAIANRHARGFGFTDTKGREFGAVAYYGTVEAFETEYVGTRRLKRAGTHYALLVQATRGGKGYGATQNVQFFDTAEERDAAMGRYFRDAERRAAKNKARG